MLNPDPDRDLPDPGDEAPETCWRHGCEMHPSRGCAECQHEQDEELTRLYGDGPEE
jgi:hypothetical protein